MVKAMTNVTARTRARSMGVLGKVGLSTGMRMHGYGKDNFRVIGM